MEEERIEEGEEEKKTVADPDWENRTLCSDESCIGVIGQDGRCKECGKPYEGTLNVTAPPIQSDADEEETETDEDASAAAEDTVASEEDSGDADSDWDARTLCSDGNCIGVIGPDGRCKECGKPYEG
jgi:hypothetical protein